MGSVTSGDSVPAGFSAPPVSAGQPGPKAKASSSRSSSHVVKGKGPKPSMNL